MDDITNLLKEAKPLYFRKKRAKKRLQRVVLGCFMIFTVIISGYGGYTIKSMSNDLATADVNSVESYLPVDEYGLITVAY